MTHLTVLFASLTLGGKWVRCKSSCVVFCCYCCWYWWLSICDQISLVVILIVFLRHHILLIIFFAFSPKRDHSLSTNSRKPSLQPLSFSPINGPNVAACMSQTFTHKRMRVDNNNNKKMYQTSSHINIQTHAYILGLYYVKFNYTDYSILKWGQHAMYARDQAFAWLGLV